MSFDPRRLRRLDELKALSHSLRLDIIEELVLTGPKTASELGEALGETPANCSWHLRKLAEFGFVEETGDGRGRRRPWRVTRVGVTWDEDAEDLDSPGFRAASEALSARLLEREVARWRRNISASGRGWADLGMTQNVAPMTQQEARQFSEELRALLMRYHDRLTGAEPIPDGARLVHMLALTSVEPDRGTR